MVHHSPFQLEVRSLCKQFDRDLNVLDNLSFCVHRGEFLVILGPSGCGKTTLLRLIAGLEKPDRGSIYIAGREVTTLEPKARDVAMVFQNYALYPHLSVFDNIAFSLRARRMPKSQVAAKVKEAAAMLELTDQLDKKPAQLSGGQRQRVALGRAIVRNPALFLFDEPLSNLDADLRVRMRGELLRLHRYLGATSLYVTHDQIEALTLADRILLLNDGKQIGPASPRALYDDPPDLFTACFLGSPPINTLHGTSSADGMSLTLNDGTVIRSEIRLPPSRRLIYGFRPEHCRFDPSGTIDVIVTGLEDHGREYVIELAGPGGCRLFCRAQEKLPLGSKQKLKVDLFRLFDPANSLAIPPEQQ